jgi:hypothetical protein
MILEGLRRRNGVAALSALVGDRASNIEAARAVSRGAALLIDRGGSQRAAAVSADVVVKLLCEAIAYRAASPAGKPSKLHA